MEENKNIFELSPEELEQATGGKDQKVVATKSGVPIRSGPGESYGIVGKTKAGAIATYTKEMQYVKGVAWIHVKWTGNNGWIPAEYVKIV